MLSLSKEIPKETLGEAQISIEGTLNIGEFLGKREKHSYWSSCLSNLVASNTLWFHIYFQTRNYQGWIEMGNLLDTDGDTSICWYFLSKWCVWQLKALGAWILQRCLCFWHSVWNTKEIISFCLLKESGKELALMLQSFLLCQCIDIG